MHQAPTCAAGFYFPTNPAEIPSQMTTYDDNSSEARPQVEDGPKDTDVSPIITAELALLDMLARLIVDAVQHHSLQPDANDP
jgi:hypothetical protein